MYGHNTPWIYHSPQALRPHHQATSSPTHSPTHTRSVLYCLGSNGSLHLHDQVATAAWIISSGPQSFLSATFLMESINSYTSHRIELEGIFRALHHLDYLNMTPKMVDQWCNNMQAVKDTTEPIQDPSGMLKAEANIILAIHHLKNRHPYQTRIRHVSGHQDTKTRKTDTDPHQQPLKATPAQVLINIACNKIAATRPQKWRNSPTTSPNTDTPIRGIKDNAQNR